MGGVRLQEVSVFGGSTVVSIHQRINVKKKNKETVLRHPGGNIILI